MPFGDGIRYNIAHVDPSERALLRDAILQLNQYSYPGTRTDSPPGGVSWWFKQDEIHRSNHVHEGPNFVPWHREIVNRFEALLRQINPNLSMHYWDWTQDPRAIPNANLGGGVTDTLNLFTSDFMGYGGPTSDSIGEPFLSAGFYVPGADPYRSTDSSDQVNNNPADPPREVLRKVDGLPADPEQDDAVLAAAEFSEMAFLLQSLHDAMHGFVFMGFQHTAFRDPFVFLLHSNMDRLFARWQTLFPHRLNPATVYGAYGASLDGKVWPWSGGQGEPFEFPVRPWAPPEGQQVHHTYKDPSVVAPPCYDTNLDNFYILEAENNFNAATGRHRVVFNDVPEEETTWRAAVIRVFTCGDATFELSLGEVKPAAPFGLATPSVQVAHGTNVEIEARVWFKFTAGPVGTAPQSLAVVNTSIRCVETGQDFPLELVANTIKRPTVAVQLALDQSGSMAWAAGTSGATRLQLLKEAATMFANLIQKNNGIGIIRFDHDAYPPDHWLFDGMSIERVLTEEMEEDSTRKTARIAIDKHGTHGGTSVGDGLEMARGQLAALPDEDYTLKAILVLTDGIETQPKSIADVGTGDLRTYAIGLGNELQVNTAALTQLAGSTNGKMLLTGVLGPAPEDQFRLKKYFQEILAGVTNTQIVKDPIGYVAAGVKVRIPFTLNEADINCRVILLADAPLVKLSLESPTGAIVDAASAPGTSMMFDATADLETVGFTLPAVLSGNEAPVGTWQAVLEIDPDFESPFSVPAGLANANGAEYCISIHAFSNLRMEARLDQSGFTPGSTLFLRAQLTEYGVPVDHRAEVEAEVQYPDGTGASLPFTEIQPGVFEASLATSLAGIYRFIIMAEGVTFRGTPFTREQLLTAAVWHDIIRPTGALKPDRPSGRRVNLLAGIVIVLLLLIALLLWRP